MFVTPNHCCDETKNRGAFTRLTSIKSKYICHNRYPHAYTLNQTRLLGFVLLSCCFTYSTTRSITPAHCSRIHVYKGERLWNYLNTNNCLEKQNRNLLWGLYMSKTWNLVFLELNIDRENINILIFKDRNIAIFTVNFLKQLCLLFHFLLIFAIISKVIFKYTSKGYPRWH